MSVIAKCHSLLLNELPCPVTGCRAGAKKDAPMSQKKSAMKGEERQRICMRP